MNQERELIYWTIAREIQKAGYQHVTGPMIADIHSALEAGDDLPYGIIGTLAKGQLEVTGLTA
jgi:hypothetical protein